MIYVIGDSHLSCFIGNPAFTVIGIGSPTAHNLKNKVSTSDSNRKLFEAINSTNRERDTVILTCGEIDCRVHIYYQYKKREGRSTIDSLIRETVENYGEVMQQLADMGVKFVILGIPPPGSEPNIWNVYHFATPEEQAQIYRDFNRQLGEYCESKGFRYLDIYSRTVGPDGHMSPEYAADKTHLGERAQPIMIELLGKLSPPVLV